MRRARGFTLIELAVTFVILGVVAAVSMYGYQSFYRGSLDTDTEERLREVAASEAVLAHDWGRFSDHPADFPALADHLTVVNHGATQPEEVSVVVGDHGHVGLAALSKSGSCLFLRVAPLLEGGDATVVKPDAVGCHGGDALPVGETAKYLPARGPAVTH